MLLIVEVLPVAESLGFRPNKRFNRNRDSRLLFQSQTRKHRQERISAATFGHWQTALAVVPAEIALLKMDGQRIVQSRRDTLSFQMLRQCVPTLRSGNIKVIDGPAGCRFVGKHDLPIGRHWGQKFGVTLRQQPVCSRSRHLGVAA